MDGGVFPPIDTRTADRIWLAILVLAVAGEIYLVRSGRSPLTYSARRRRLAVTAFGVLFLLHVNERPRALSRYDPFRLIGRVLS